LLKKKVSWNENVKNRNYWF